MIRASAKIQFKILPIKKDDDDEKNVHVMLVERRSFSLTMVLYKWFLFDILGTKVPCT